MLQEEGSTGNLTSEQSTSRSRSWLCLYVQVVGTVTTGDGYNPAWKTKGANLLPASEAEWEREKLVSRQAYSSLPALHQLQSKPALCWKEGLEQIQLKHLPKHHSWQGTEGLKGNVAETLGATLCLRGQRSTSWIISLTTGKPNVSMMAFCPPVHTHTLCCSTFGNRKESALVPNKTNLGTVRLVYITESQNS